LQSGDVDDTIVVRRVWHLNTKSKDSYQNTTEICARDELIVTFEEHIVGSDFFEHPVNHSDKASNQINFIHDIGNEWVFSNELKLILHQGIVECHYVSI
jgi:hypothetical protein